MNYYEKMKTLSLDKMAQAIMCPNDIFAFNAEIPCLKKEGIDCIECSKRFLQMEVPEKDQ